MSLFDLFRRKKDDSANIAKERLQVIVSHQRAQKSNFDENRLSEAQLKSLQQEILAVISKYIPINQEQMKMELDQMDGCSVLELNVTLPETEKSEKSETVLS